MIVKRPYIFDSHALLTLFQKEKGHDKIVRLLNDISRTKNVKYLNAINLGEIIYITMREFGQHKKLEVLANIERLGFTILPAVNDLIFRAAEYKARFSISYADCFILASAVENNAVIVTGDPEFRKTAHLAEVFWTV
jgi:predicted nucleic acid-binding protein